MRRRVRGAGCAVRALACLLLSTVIPLVGRTAGTTSLNLSIGGSQQYSTDRVTAKYWSASVSGQRDASGQSASGIVTVSPESQSKSTAAAFAFTISGVKEGRATVTVKYGSKSNQIRTTYATYAVSVSAPRTPVAPPTVATGLVYGYTNQIGVVAGEGYTLTGTTSANAVGTYSATATPRDGYCWPDGSTAAKVLTWSIGYRPAKVSVIGVSKTLDAEDPLFRTQNANFIADDASRLVWKVWRTNACEAVGTYDLVIGGAKHQGGYEISFTGGTLTIMPPKPSIPEAEGDSDYDSKKRELTVLPAPGVTDISVLNLPADGTVVLPASVESVRGVEARQIRVSYTAPDAAGGQTYDITAAFAFAGNAADGVGIALDPESSVAFGTGNGEVETVLVRPVLVDGEDPNVLPFWVSAGAVGVCVRTIPGLTYRLLRSPDPGDVRQAGVAVDSQQAEGLRTQLRDSLEDGRPSRAFYVIGVRRP